MSLKWCKPEKTHKPLVSCMQQINVLGIIYQEKETQLNENPPTYNCFREKTVIQFLLIVAKKSLVSFS